jgi:proline iminopeptidase
MKFMTLEDGFVSVTGGEVWYRKVKGGGNLTPLLVLHGGPGSTSLPLQCLNDLAEGRDVIFYDQLGSGLSSRPDDKSLWNLDRFVEELGQVRKELGLNEVHILGHSWGTTLLASYLLTNPTGVKSSIFSSPCLSAPRWAEDQKIFLQQLPPETQEVINRCEAEGTTDSDEYKKAMREFYKRHVCRLDPWPEVMTEGSKRSNGEIYNIMWGPSEFCVTGNLKDFDCTPSLHEVKTESLFLCGRFDEATPESTAYFASLVPGAKLHVFENSSHTGYLEEHDEYINAVKDFLKIVEA